MLSSLSYKFYVVNASQINLMFSDLKALLVLHQPEIIEQWNPDAPMETFWDIRYGLT